MEKGYRDWQHDAVFFCSSLFPRHVTGGKSEALRSRFNLKLPVPGQHSGCIMIVPRCASDHLIMIVTVPPARRHGARVRERRLGTHSS